jgi:hypothetical protein
MKDYCRLLVLGVRPNIKNRFIPREPISETIRNDFETIRSIPAL